MKKIVLIFILLCSPALAFDLGGNLTAASNTGRLYKWKSVRVQAVATGTITHFVVEVKDINRGTWSDYTNINVGWAVYDGTAGLDDPIGAIKCRGYVEGYDFSGGVGFYQFPITEVYTDANIVAGNYYHLTWLAQEPGKTGIDDNFGADIIIGREGDCPCEPKWSAHYDPDYADSPPQVGAEPDWDWQYVLTSGPYGMGIVDEGVAGLGSPTNLTIIID